MPRIFVTGDTHGELDNWKLEPKFFEEAKNLTKDDYVIVLGDFGALWTSYTKGCPNRLSDRDKYVIDWFENLPFTVLWIDGNHENFVALDTFPMTEWNGGCVHKISHSVIHLMRGQIFNIAGKTFFTMGGADSIDKGSRIENLSWWREEMPSKREYEEAMTNLESVNFKVDYVLTHCCGTQLLPSLFTVHNDGDPLTQFLLRLEENFGLEFKHWYFGHHHQDKKIDDKHTCVYDEIIELE